MTPRNREVARPFLFGGWGEWGHFSGFRKWPYRIDLARVVELFRELRGITVSGTDLGGWG